MADAALARAVDHLVAGDWQQAHTIVQKDESMLAAWIHGIVHILEGDLRNAQGWYGKTDRAYPGPEALQTEIVAARHAPDFLDVPQPHGSDPGFTARTVMMTS